MTTSRDHRDDGDARIGCGWALLLAALVYLAVWGAAEAARWVL